MAAFEKVWAAVAVECLVEKVLTRSEGVEGEGVGPARNADAFIELVRVHDQQLRRLAYRILGDRYLMEDALQGAYLKAYRNLGKFKGHASIGTWLYRIVFNECMDELRRRRRVRLLPLDSIRERGGAGDHAELALRSQDLMAALQRLPSKDRAVLLLVDGEGLTYSEAGAVMGIPEGTVASRLTRARAKVRMIMSSKDEQS